jgi:hypothetical protein
VAGFIPAFEFIPAFGLISVPANRARMNRAPTLPQCKNTGSKWGYLGNARTIKKGAAGALGSAAGATAAEINAAIQLESVHVEIHFNRLGFFEKLRIDDKFKTVDVEFRIRFGKLIQSHGQARAPSPALVEEDANGLDLFPFEILGNLLNCRLCDFEHDILLAINPSPIG